MVWIPDPPEADRLSNRSFLAFDSRMTDKKIN